MTSDIKFESLSQVEEYALKNKKILLVYDDYVLDATSFACHHPGGPGLIKNFQTKNVTK
jgi:cytochrome b involved in lipid metabolism